MPIVTLHDDDPAIDGRQSDIALAVRRGVMTGLRHADWVFVPELTLPNGRRADLTGLDGKGNIAIIEIKSSIADYNADIKWHEYKELCDLFFFASHPSVPGHIFPEEEGFVLADNHGCEIIRDAIPDKISAATRKSMTIRIARAAASKLQRVTDFHGQLPEE